LCRMIPCHRKHDGVPEQASVALSRDLAELGDDVGDIG
jgi:hypothetical protein